MAGNSEIKEYLTRLGQASPEETVFLIRKIEKLGKGMTGIGKHLFPLIYHEDYLVRSRAFIALGRVADISLSSALIAYIDEDPGEEWQLRALEVLYLLHDVSIVPQLAKFLERRENPLLVRGTVWLLGSLGGEAGLREIIDFATGPFGRLVKSEIILEAAAIAVSEINDGMAFFNQLLQENPAAARYFRYCKLPDLENRHYYVYPYPDYLLEHASWQEIDRKVFKKLFFWDRD